MPAERWFCLDCHKIVDLDRHGNCSSCFSGQVVSDQLENRILEQFPKRIANESHQDWLSRLRAENAATERRRDEQRRIDDLDRASGVQEYEEPE
jgi:hypothetical protein